MRVASSMKSLHLFLNSKQRSKLKTANRGGTLFTTSAVVSLVSMLFKNGRMIGGLEGQLVYM